MTVIPNALDLAGSVALAVFVVDRVANVLFHNRAAARVLGAEETFAIQNGVLTAAAHTGKLQSEIATVDEGTSEARVLTIPGRNLLPMPLLVLRMWWRESADSPEQPRVGVVVSHPCCQELPNPSALQRLYGFTPAEAAVACRLIAGEDIAVIAGRQSTSVNTVRSHLKKLFQKTGVRRQGDLLRVLLSSPTSLISELEGDNRPTESVAANCAPGNTQPFRFKSGGVG